VDYGVLDETGAGKLVGVGATLRGSRTRVYTLVPARGSPPWTAARYEALAA
jgi:hypothetical protein